MTATRAIENTPGWGNVSDWEGRLSTAIGTYGALGSRPWAEVSSIEFLPGVRVGDPEYVVPEDWLPPGVMRRLSSRTLVPDLGLPDAPQAVARARDESLRRTLFALALPRLTQTGVRRYKPSSWLNNARIVIRMARWSAASRPSSAGILWLHLAEADWQALVRDVSQDPQTATLIGILRRHLADLGRRGVIPDYPRDDLPEPATAHLGPVPERSTRGMPVLEAPRLREERSYQHFPDEFVTKFITRALWLNDNLADQVIACWERLREANVRARALNRRQSHPTTTAERRAIIAATKWSDGQSSTLDELPWDLWRREGGKPVLARAWPPTDAAAFNEMISLLQALNFCVVAFCAGGRASEILGATERSLTFDGAGRLRSRTFKLVDELDGEERDWPLHPAAVRALEVQQRIARLVRPKDADHLWVLLQDGSEPAGSPLRNINEPIVQAVGRLDLDSHTGGSRPHSHRWRHTVARLVALSVGTAPQVLMDLFGHHNLEMTIRYMLSSPEIAREALQVAEEVAHAVAREAAEDAERSAAGGSAAQPLQESLRDLAMRRGLDALDTDSMREAIEILTFGGRSWQVVRPGVLCTKGIGQYGPCTKGRGEPDPGACRTDCSHRLEAARAKHHCEHALAALLREHAAATADDQAMLVASLEGQILANLKRWDDVRERIVEWSEVARRVWAERDTKGEGG